jgi:hypothetical protein
VWGWLRGGKQKSAGNRFVLPRIRTKVSHGRFRPKVEALTERVLPAVTAVFSPTDGTLHVAGDELDNTIVVSRNGSTASTTSTAATTRRRRLTRRGIVCGWNETSRRRRL